MLFSDVRGLESLRYGLKWTAYFWLRKSSNSTGISNIRSINVLRECRELLNPLSGRYVLLIREYSMTLLLCLANNQDILNRFPYQSKTSSGPDPQTIRVMMYMFPRQFGLHNVFTSVVDPRETTQPFKDYTLREDEINKIYNTSNIKLPKRLRGRTVDLVQKLRINHTRCSYRELLDYYCHVFVLCLPCQSLLIHSPGPK